LLPTQQEKQDATLYHKQKEHAVMCVEKRISVPHYSRKKAEKYFSAREFAEQKSNHAVASQALLLLTV